MILNRYIGRTLIGMTLIVCLAVMSLDFFIQLMSEFGDVGKGNYHFIDGVSYVLFNLPKDFYQLFPMMGLIGSMLGLGLLASHSELIVMRSAGMSMMQLVTAVMYAILLMVLITTLLGEGLAPAASHQATVNKTIAKSSGQGVATQNGVWLRDGSSFIHIDQVISPEHITGITRYQFSTTHQLQTVSFAKQGLYQSKKWQVSDVIQTTLGQQIQAQHKAIATWTMQLNPMILKLATIDTQDMSLYKLYHYNQYRKANALRYANSALTFWQRMIQPITTMVMMLLAIPFIFGPLRSVTMGLRLLAGIIVGFGFFLFNEFFGPFSLVYHVPPPLAAFIPTLLFGGLGLGLVLRIR